MADNSTILEKLDGLVARFEEISTLITDPAVIADQKRYVKLTKEYKELDDLMKARKEYIQLLGNIEEAKNILANESDAEMREMAKEEMDNSQERLPVLEEEIKLMLVPADPQDSKNAILKDIFWQMNEISSRTESKTEEVITETDDGHGNIVETTTTVTHTYLYITVSNKTVEEMADHFNFTADQRKQLSELLAEENRRLWSAVLYGIYSGDDAIVKVALSQVGNVGGEPYWLWYGFESRVEWCACFVSWCFNECGYLDTGTAPKFAGCVGGVEWFRSREQWAANSVNPSPGMIVFFDWNDPNGASGPQDGEADHVGIVEKCENGIVYTIEGNSGDACRQNQYPVGYYEILGYGSLNP